MLFILRCQLFSSVLLPIQKPVEIVKTSPLNRLAPERSRNSFRMLTTRCFDCLLREIRMHTCPQTCLIPLNHINTRRHQQQQQALATVRHFRDDCHWWTDASLEKWPPRETVSRCRFAMHRESAWVRLPVALSLTNSRKSGSGTSRF